LLQKRKARRSGLFTAIAKRLLGSRSSSGVSRSSSVNRSSSSVNRSSFNRSGFNNRSSFNSRSNYFSSRSSFFFLATGNNEEGRNGHNSNLLHGGIPILSYRVTGTSD
jgi:hypothetical protein